MDDIRPPAPRPSRPQPPRPPIAPPEPQPHVVPEPPSPLPEPAKKPQLSRRKKWLISIAGVVVLLLLASAGAVIWYKSQLRPVSDYKNARHVRVEIASGSSPKAIGQQLYDDGLVRSTYIFDLYTRIHKAQNNLQAGAYNLSPAISLPELVADLTSGKVDDFTVTFLPGATVAENRQVLLKAGYEASAVDAALAKTYNAPLFAGRPKGSDLEGYIYGETYRFSADATVEDILQRTFDEYQTQIDDNNLVNLYKKQKLSLFEGITLASIIQREVSGEADERQVAQVFFKRLNAGGALGADATYKYAAKRFNLVNSPDQESKYNTRKSKGLTPGPISTPGIGALLAVAHPAKGDFEYFLSGDDGKTYFAHSFAQHKKNITDHCKINCAE